MAGGAEGDGERGKPGVPVGDVIVGIMEKQILCLAGRPTAAFEFEQVGAGSRRQHTNNDLEDRCDIAGVEVVGQRRCPPQMRDAPTADDDAVVVTATVHTATNDEETAAATTAATATSTTPPPASFGRIKRLVCYGILVASLLLVIAVAAAITAIVLIVTSNNSENAGVGLDAAATSKTATAQGGEDASTLIGAFSSLLNPGEEAGSDGASDGSRTAPGGGSGEPDTSTMTSAPQLPPSSKAKNAPSKEENPCTVKIRAQDTCFSSDSSANLEVCLDCIDSYFPVEMYCKLLDQVCAAANLCSSCGSCGLEVAETLSCLSCDSEPVVCEESYKCPESAKTLKTCLGAGSDCVQSVAGRWKWDKANILCSELEEDTCNAIPSFTSCSGCEDATADWLGCLTGCGSFSC